MIRTIGCQLGLSKDCLRQELKEERHRLEEMKALFVDSRTKNAGLTRQNAEMMARNTEMEALFERLSSLDHAASSYIVFLKDDSAEITVTSGHEYASLIEPDTLTNAFCYVYLSVDGAGLRQVTFGNMSDNGFVSWSRYSTRELRGTGLSKADISRLQENCEWPRIDS